MSQPIPVAGQPTTMQPVYPAPPLQSTQYMQPAGLSHLLPALSGPTTANCGSPKENQFYRPGILVHLYRLVGRCFLVSNRVFSLPYHAGPPDRTTNAQPPPSGYDP